MQRYSPAIMNLTDICSQLDVTDAVLSPGSRNAPLMLALARHSKIKTQVMVDERAAAFVALGMAQQQQRPVVLACTSGTAPLNYAPAIAEAFYQHVPLIVLTADRPPEWIDQQDGQTIEQPQMYNNRVKASYNLPVENDHPDVTWHIERSITEALHIATTHPHGPVHVNIPFREPFYPAAEQTIEFSPRKVTQQIHGYGALNEDQWLTLTGQVKQAKRLLIVAGQQVPLSDQIQVLGQLNYVVVGDITSNLHSLERVVQHADMFLEVADKTLKQQLRPDLLITFGLSTLSKNLKLYLRTYSAAQHWHVQLAGKVADPYQSLTQIIRLSPEIFLHELQQRLPPQLPNPYFERWQTLEHNSRKLVQQFFAQTQPLNEFHAVKQVLSALPKDCVLHLGNSMAVRYANFIGLPPHQIRVFANRGTSGIEGSMSTAVGHCRATTALNVLLLGDLSFFYDRNALWSNTAPPDNLRIIVLNNHGGGIFTILPDSSQLPECNEFFTTQHTLDATNTAKDFGLLHYACRKQAELEHYLDGFFAPGPTKLLEIHTELQRNTEYFRSFKQYWRSLCPTQTSGNL